MPFSELKKFCGTRCAERYEGILIFLNRFLEIITDLEDLLDENNASFLHNVTCDFQF